MVYNFKKHSIAACKMLDETIEEQNRGNETNLTRSHKHGLPDNRKEY